MATEAQVKVNSAVKDFVNTVDRGHLRKMEKRMHECAAQCCGNMVAQVEEVSAAAFSSSCIHTGPL